MGLMTNFQGLEIKLGIKLKINIDYIATLFPKILEKNQKRKGIDAIRSE